MKRLIYLAAATLVAVLILVPTAMAQTEMTVEMEKTQPLPKSGGPAIGSPSVLLPTAVLLMGAGVLGYAVLRRR